MSETRRGCLRALCGFVAGLFVKPDMSDDGTWRRRFRVVFGGAMLWVQDDYIIAGVTHWRYKPQGIPEIGEPYV